MVKPYTLDQAQEQVQHAIETSKDRHASWRVLEALYRTGDLAVARSTEAGRLALDKRGITDDVVNLVLPHINVIVASSAGNDPTHIAVPYGGGAAAEDAAYVANAVIRYFWVRTRATLDLRDSVQDLVVLGNGFLKTGWNFEERQVDKERHEIDEEIAALLEADRLEAQLEERDPFDPQELADQVLPTKAVAERDEPFLEYVSPYDVFVPQDARRIHTTRWVAHRVTLPVEEVEDNDGFDAEARGDLKHDGTVDGASDVVAEWRRQAEDAKGVQGRPSTFDTVTLFEFYDLRADHLLVFQLDADKPLYEGPMPWSHRYGPFVHLRNFSANGNDFWAFGDLENIASLQAAFNEFIREQLDNARRAGNKYVVDKKYLTPELREALTSDESDVVAPIELPNGKTIGDVVQSLERKALSGDVYAAKVDLEDYLRKILGINDFQAGGSGADRMSATAAAMVDGVASLRAQAKRQQVEEAAAHAGLLLLLLCQEFLDQPRAIRIAGENGVAWPNVSAADLHGEFLVNVEGGSTQSVNPATREQKALQAIREVAPMLAQMGYDPHPVIRKAMRDLGWDDSMIQKSQPEAPPEPPGGVPSGQPPGPAAMPVAAGAPEPPALREGDLAL